MQYLKHNMNRLKSQLALDFLTLRSFSTNQIEYAIEDINMKEMDYSHITFFEEWLRLYADNADIDKLFYEIKDSRNSEILIEKGRNENGNYNTYEKI